MGQFGEQIAALPLYELLLSKGKKGSSADVMKLTGMVTDAADIAGPLLANIPVTFKQYTVHDVAHAANLIDLMGRFIPKKTQKAMSGVEVAVLMLSALLHDLGMYVTEEEKEEVLASFPSFLAASPETERALAEAKAGNRRGAERAIEDAALADYFRKKHPHRAGLNIDRYLAGKFMFNDFDLAPWIKMICESHGWAVYESTDPAHPDHAIVRALKPSDPLPRIPFHPQYIACCLRLADIMDFDRSRTPLALLRTITDETSQGEWQKHLQITGWEIDEHNVEFHASCTHPEHYVAVMEFLDAVDHELLECRRLIVRDATQQTTGYTLALPTATDRIHVQMADKSYVAGGFRFELEYERILKLLMDKSLYPDPSLFLRELLQNSLDACRLRAALIEEDLGKGQHYTPHIVIWDNSTDPSDPTIIFQDNGIGMSEEVVKNYFMRVGRSYYRSGDFNAQRERLEKKGIALEATSRFGIGFLSCFMAGDRIEIETYRKGETPLHITIEGPTKFFVVQRLRKPTVAQLDTLPETAEADGPPRYAGTRITVHLRAGVTLNVTQVIKMFAVNIESDVVIHTKEECHVVPAWAWENIPITPASLPVHTYGASTAMQDVLISVEIDLARYDFMHGIHGRAWFWFLRGIGGVPVPRQGHLEISSGISPVGPPLIVCRTSLEDLKLLERDDIVEGDTVLKPMIAKLWNEKTEEWRTAARNWITKSYEHLNCWHRHDSIPAALLAGDDSWMNYNVNYHDSSRPSRLQSLALHGIEVSAGVTAWDPMSGQAERLTLFHFAGGFLIDDRRGEGPVPAASRLFVDPSEGNKTMPLVARAFLESAIELWMQHQPDVRWTKWLDEFLRGAEAYWEQVAFAQAPRLRSLLPVEAPTEDLTIEEFRKTCRRWAPVHTSESPGLWRYSGRNKFLFADKAYRRRDDGVAEIDLDSKLAEFSAESAWYAFM
jgi:Histidine kinase-, DNA gyrase B-, and HSP90-like ATPase